VVLRDTCFISELHQPLSFGRAKGVVRKLIYLDNAATTSLHEDVLSQMMPYFTALFGNPSSIHQMGRVSRQGIDKARKQVATWLNCSPGEIVFTSGGTESNHSALFGAMLGTHRRHIVASKIEHHAVLHTLDFLHALGAQITLVPPRENGIVDPQAVLQALQPDTFCVTLMAVNNETGAIQPTEVTAKLVKEVDKKILFHSDMVQALGTLPIDLANSSIDLASFSAHKIHGPKGVGALYIKSGTAIKPVIHGGSQEKKRRAGTENVAGIVGFGAAVERLQKGFDSRITHLLLVNKAFREQIQDIAGLVCHTPSNAVPTIINIGISGVRNDTLLMRLDLEGIAASAGSACTAGSLEPSHVLLASGCTEAELKETIRFSFSEDTEIEEAVSAANALKKIIVAMKR
jgi:cysteine desulfurase